MVDARGGAATWTGTETFDWAGARIGQAEGPAARIGHPHCPTCGQPVVRQSATQMVDRVLAWPAKCFRRVEESLR